MMFPFGATFCVAIDIDHVGHGGIHCHVPIEVGLPHARGQIRVAKSMNGTNEAKL
jgi:hypothetical protein